MTRLRRDMFGWLNGPGQSFRNPLPNSTNYLSAYDRRGQLMRKHKEDGSLEEETSTDLRPFPQNAYFQSQTVLGEDLRNEIYRQVKEEGKTVRAVSVELGVDMRRVGAVVRLVEIERRWRSEGKQIAAPYQKAIHSMIPTKSLDTEGRQKAFESINDLPVNSLTQPQIFYPTSESRPFNRVDAGRVFSAAPRLPDESPLAHPHNRTISNKKQEIIGKGEDERPVLLPADSRIPHSHMIDYFRDDADPAFKYNDRAKTERYNARLRQDQVDRMLATHRKQAADDRRTTRVETPRWEILVKEVKATREGTGLNGRGTKSPGIRYGVPSQDRKRGAKKIPQKVEV
ncbi:MAG: hypothetical protein Q9227_003022 [Pyrenula ochraceoflavens]